jgi:ABC-type antimicrobial peptide transport system permease subunit
MFGTYLRRELANRRRQTIIIAVGMALAIALVILVNAAASGVRNAEGTALQTVYGVGTDITVTKAATTASTDGGRQAFRFGSGSGSTSGGTQSVSRSRLATEPGTTAFAATAVTKAAAASGVKAATGVLSLSNTTFTGQLPTPGQGGFGERGSGATRPTGGPDGAGGSSFGIDRVSVLGYDVKGATIGPLTAATLTKGRSLTASDSGEYRAVLDADYATSAKKAVGSTLALGGKTFTVVGIVKSTSASGASASNAYIPLDTAQTLSSEKGEVSSVYVEATSAAQIDTVKAELQRSLGSSMTVNTQSDLASSVTGSLATAASLANSLGLWLSVLVLAAAFLIAVLFTVSGVTRRTREFGTLKAIGWSDRRIVGQVAGESFVQGLIGGAIGIALGLLAILVVDLIHPTLTASAAATGRGFGFGGGAPGGAAGAFPSGAEGFGRAARSTATAASDIVLNLPVSPSVIAIAVALAVLGGLVAGAFGGWRASRLRPAEALRSVA